MLAKLDECLTFSKAFQDIIYVFLYSKLVGG